MLTGGPKRSKPLPGERQPRNMSGRSIGHMTISTTHFFACSKPATIHQSSDGCYSNLHQKHQKKKFKNQKDAIIAELPMSFHRTLGSLSIISLLTCSMRRGSRFLNFSGSSPSGPHSISKLA